MQKMEDSQRQLVDIYRNGTYEQSNPTWHAQDAPWKARQIASILTDNNVSFKRVCEVGCGTGEILVQLTNSFPDARFSGYDVSPQAIEMATSRQRPGLSFQLHDVVEEPVASFDLALVIDVVEHVEDYFGFVRKVRSLGTTKVFHIPLDLSVQSLIRMSPILGLRESVGHIHYFAKETALALLRDCGYTILDWRYTASRLELPDQTRSSRLMAPPRRFLHKLSPDFAVRMVGGYSLLVLAV